MVSRDILSFETCPKSGPIIYKGNISQIYDNKLMLLRVKTTSQINILRVGVFASSMHRTHSHSLCHPRPHIMVPATGRDYEMPISHCNNHPPERGARQREDGLFPLIHPRALSVYFTAQCIST